MFVFQASAHRAYPVNFVPYLDDTAADLDGEEQSWAN